MDRLDYIIKKALFGVITLFAVIVFNFFLFRILPGDPVSMLMHPRMRPETKERIITNFGLDKPVWINLEEALESGKPLRIFDSQFVHYLNQLSSGDFGESFKYRKPVSELMADRIWPTILLILAGQVTGIVFGVILGLLAAWKKGTSIDITSMIVGMAIWALPAFWLGIVLMVLGQGRFPAGGFVTAGVEYTSRFEEWKDIALHLMLPALTMALLLFGSYMLVVRNSTLEVLSDDYIATAKAKGLSDIKIIIRHALKNASLPLVTIIALDLGYALGGMVQIEAIFSWPGIGQLMYDGIATRDYPVLQGVFLLLAFGVITANILADFSYAILDPRVKS